MTAEKNAGSTVAPKAPMSTTQTNAKIVKNQFGRIAASTERIPATRPNSKLVATSTRLPVYLSIKLPDLIWTAAPNNRLKN
jgi:hypothetical protein